MRGHYFHFSLFLLLFIFSSGSLYLAAEGNGLIQQLECGRDRASATMNGDEAKYFSEIVDNTIQAIESGNRRNPAIQQHIFVNQLFQQNPDLFTYGLGVSKKSDENSEQADSDRSGDYDPDKPQANVRARYALRGHLADIDLSDPKQFEAAAQQIVANYGGGSILPTGWWIFNEVEKQKRHLQNIARFSENTEAIAEAGPFEGSSATQDFAKAAVENAWDLRGVDYSMYAYGYSLTLPALDRTLHFETTEHYFGLAQNIESPELGRIGVYTAPFMADGSVLNPARFVLFGLPGTTNPEDVWNKRFGLEFV